MRILLSLFLALPLSVAAWPAGKKLVMKDGSYQVVRTWERKGDRVRYYSLERNDWEELPASLVDWAATEKANAEAGEQAEERVKVAVETEREAAREALGPEIAPGVYMPSNDGLFVVQNGQAVAIPKQQASSRVDKGRVLTNIVLPIPVLKNRNLVEIPGARATLRLDASPAALFANGKARKDSRYVLARLKAKGQKRQIGAISTNIIGRNPQHSGDYVELKEEAIGADIFKLTPARALEPGEYAILEFLGNDLNAFLWDFGVGR